MAGWIVWEGPAALGQREPVVVIATLGSKNTKTGEMIQTWILRRDMHPAEAAKGGKGDADICGTCPLRGSETQARRCYVNTAFAPSSIWKAFQRGAYGKEMPAAAKGVPLRMGAYGDPAAVPFSVWRDLLAQSESKTWTGYTHQWKFCDPAFATLCMASVETTGEADSAHAYGWRTFRTGWQVKGGEISCPASKEMGYRTTCGECGLCAGGGRPGAKHIVIQPHGSTKERF